MLSDRVRRALYTSLPAAAAAAVWSIRDLFESDIWVQLATGRWMAEHHQIVRTEPFSLTCAGHAFTNHEWLFQLGLYQLFAFGGIPAILLTKALLWALVIVLLIRSFPRDFMLQGALLAAAFAAMFYRNMARPELIAYVLIAWNIGTFLQESDRPPEPLRRFLRRPELWVGCGLIVLWVNVHGSFLLIFGLLGIAALDWVKERPSWRQRLAGNPFIWTGACYALAMLVNPFGIHLVTSVLRISPQLLARETGYLLEFNPTPLRGYALYWGLIALAWVSLGISAWRTQRVRLIEWGWLLYATWIGGAMQRMAATAVVILIPLLARSLNSWVGLKPRSQSRYALTVAALALIVIGIPRMRWGVNTSLLPVGAADFIEAHLPAGTASYNDLNFGSYLIWRFYGQRRPVFLDGRVHPIEGYLAFLREAAAARDFTPEGLTKWRALQVRYNFDWCLMFIPRHRLFYAGQPVSVFAYYFPRRDWALVGYDKVWALYVRRRSERAALLKTYEIHSVTPDTDSPAGPLVPWESLFSLTSTPGPPVHRPPG